MTTKSPITVFKCRRDTAPGVKVQLEIRPETFAHFKALGTLKRTPKVRMEEVLDKFVKENTSDEQMRSKGYKVTYDALARVDRVLKEENPETAKQRIQNDIKNK